MAEPTTIEAEETAPTPDGATVALRHFGSDRPARASVLLTHGTFSNGKLCGGLARHLSECGFECWVLDWRGHGHSPAAPHAYSYEQLALAEVRAGLAWLEQRPGASGPAFWIGHSAGGVLPLLRLARYPEEGRHFRGIVTLGSQVTHAGHAWANRLLLASGSRATRWLGRAPGPLLRLGPEDEGAPLMDQWFRWNLSGEWRGDDGFDYMAALARIDVPLLCFAGGADRLIAPLAGCQRLFQAVGSHDKQLVVCAKANGFAHDFGHGSLIAGQRAQSEVWPRIRAWLEERTPSHVERSALGA